MSARRVFVGLGVVADIVAGAHRDQLALAVGREGDVAGPVMTDRHVGHDRLGLAGRDQVAGLVGIAQHVAFGRDIDIFGVGPRREGDAVGPVLQPLGESARRGCRIGAGGGADHADALAVALGEEDVAVGGEPHLPRAAEPGEELGDGEPRRQRQLRVRGLRHQLRHVAGGFRRIGRRQVGGVDEPRHPRRRFGVIAIGRGAGEHLPVVGERHRRGGGYGESKRDPADKGTVDRAHGGPPPRIGGSLEHRRRQWNQPQSSQASRHPRP